MKKLYINKLNYVLILLVLLSFFVSSRAIGQTIYKGDSVQLSLNGSYRGTVQWQESLKGTTWTDISGGTTSKMLVKPLVNTYYRAVVTEQACDPIYSGIQLVTISQETGIVVSLPVVSSFKAISAELKGEIKQLGGTAKVIERGMCWSKFNTPTINDSKTSDGTGIGAFTSTMTGLTENTIYSIRSYAITDENVVVYSNVITVVSPPAVAISFIDAHNITTTAATSGGEVKLNGTETAIARGVCWSTSENPTIANNKTTDGAGEGTYASSLTNLLPEKVYYLRAYVTSSNGKTYYSTQISFETLSTYTFTVQTTNVSAITGTSANSGGNVTMTGTGAAAARGVCWSTSEEPTVANSKTTNGTGVGNFASTITGLAPSTVYYVRAYVTSSTGKTIYGNQHTFTTNSAFTVTTTAATAITAATATLGGNITITTPGAVILSRGVCYGTEINPTITTNKTEDGTTAGIFTTSLSELKANTRYYVRAYATDGNNKTTYGNELSFTTELPLVVTVVTSNPSSITLSSAVSGGTITTTGPGSITAKGICISTEPSPTLENNKTIDGTGTTAFTSALNNLVAGEKFYIRAYATSNSGITTYGNEIAFNALAPISVITGSVGAITANSAKATGRTEIIEQNRKITARGFCWSTSPNPTIANTKSTENVLVYGALSTSLSGLTGNTTYYIRAYATSESDVVYYGNEVVFKTAQPFSTNLVLNAATAITNNTASISGTYSSSGMGAIIGMGIAYGTSPNPIYDSKAQFGNLLPTFNYNFKDLIAGTTYYARAYAVTDSGLQYSNQVIFKTVGYNSTVKMDPATELTSTSARLKMTFTMAPTEERIGSGILVSPKPNATLDNYPGSTAEMKIGSQVSTGNDYSVIYEGFVYSTIYYAKGYVKMKDNTVIYSNEISFTTSAAAVSTLKVNTIVGTTGVTEKAAGVFGRYSAIGGMKKIGFCYSINAVPTVADNLAAGSTNNNISIIDGAQYPNFGGAFSNLLPSTKYYYRAYAIDLNGALVYGDILSLTTLAPTRTFNVNTPEATKIASTTATLGWNVFSPNVAANAYQRGVVYSLKPNPTRSDLGAGEPATFSVSSWPITGLIPNSTYYARAFAYDPVTQLTHYGNEITFKTQYYKLLNLELTDPPSEQTSTSARFNMNIYGEEFYHNVGFAYSTSPQPTIDNTKAVDVAGVQYFTDSMTYFGNAKGLTLNTTYYVRGYAQLNSGDKAVYSNEVVFKTASLKVETYMNGGTGGLNYITSNRIINYGTETVVQRGLVYGVVSDYFPTLESSYYTFEGTGTADFTAKVELPAYSTRYYIRAYAKTQSGNVIYGNVIDYTTPANPNPPTTTPPVCNGCTNPPPVTPPVVSGPGYLIFGRATGPAKLDCREGSGIFSDYKGYSTALVQGAFTNASYSTQREQMMAHLKSTFPGDKYEYSVESSYNYSPTAKVAVIIEYKKKIPAWDCYSTLVTIGYGSNEAEALAKAVERKNNDINGAKEAKYTKLKTITW